MHCMNRRQWIVAAIASVCAASSAVAAEAPPPADILRKIYEREIERHNKRLPPDHSAFYALFTRPLRALINAPPSPNPNVPLGRIVHALFGHGALPGREVTLRDVKTIREHGISATVNVALSVFDNPRDVVVTLHRDGNGWLISEIEYAPGDTLSAHHRRRIGQ
jgi:hypothetical protein